MRKKSREGRISGHSRLSEKETPPRQSERNTLCPHRKRIRNQSCCSSSSQSSCLCMSESAQLARKPSRSTPHNVSTLNNGTFSNITMCHFCMHVSATPSLSGIHRALVRVCGILTTLQARNPAPPRGQSRPKLCAAP